MKRLRLLLVMVCIIVMSGISVFCGTNNGTVYADPASETLDVELGLEGVKFYDFFIPYNLTLKESGGWASGVTENTPADNPYRKWFAAFDESKLSLYRFGVGIDDLGYWGGAGLNIFGENPESTRNIKIFDSFTKEFDSNGLTYITVKDKNGKEMKVYMAAVGKCFFDNNIITGGAFDTYSSSNRGALYDVILADGTQIHFAVSSAFGKNHMLGGDPPSTTGGNQDGVGYVITPLNASCKQYVGLTHCAPPYQMFEVCAKSGTSSSSIKSALGISSSNPVVAVRFYDAKIDSASFTIRDGFEEAVNKGSAPGSCPASSSAINSENALKGFYDEMDLAAWSYLNGESVIKFKDRSDLKDQSELNSLHNWEENVDMNKFTYTRYIRYCISFAGIAFIIWGMFLYLGYWFDRINTIFPFSMVSFLTKGALMLSPDESECTFKLSDTGKGKAKTVNHKTVIEICLLAILFGTLLVSGAMYKIIAWIIRFVFAKLS